MTMVRPPRALAAALVASVVAILVFSVAGLYASSRWGTLSSWDNVAFAGWAVAGVCAFFAFYLLERWKERNHVPKLTLVQVIKGVEVS